MVHMVQEYARHNGHADLLREGVDGTVGGPGPEAVGARRSRRSR